MLATWGAHTGERCFSDKRGGQGHPQGKRSIDRRSQVDIVSPFQVQSLSYLHSLCPPASPLFPLFSPGPHPAFPLFGSTGPTTVVWLPLCLRHFWKHDSWKKKGTRTATKSLEPYHLCSCSEKTHRGAGPTGEHTGMFCLQSASQEARLGPSKLT